MSLKGKIQKIVDDLNLWLDRHPNERANETYDIVWRTRISLINVINTIEDIENSIVINYSKKDQST